MSITTDTNAPSTEAAAPAFPDPRPAFAGAVALGRSVVAALGADQFELPTPCPAMDVRAMTGHLLGVLERIAVIGGGLDPFTVSGHVDIADDERVAAYDRLAADALAVWSDDTVLTDLVTVPWTQMPGAVALMIYTSEVSVHTWDLAVATGQQPEWDDDVIAVGHGAMQIGLPAEDRMAYLGVPEGEESTFPVPFANAITVAADAPLIDQHVAWVGRNPSWSPTVA